MPRTVARPAEPPSSQDPVVRFETVGLRYGRDPEVLKDVSFTLTRGSFHFLTGPSGAGKTSLLRLIHLARRATRGRVILFGRDVDQASRAELPALRRRIGVVFQEFRLLDHLSAFDNAALPLRVAGRKPAQYEQDVTELLTWVGLGPRLHAMAPTLSGGEKQRLAIARAVLNRPELLIADEPTGNVDEEMALRILKLLVELHRMGTTVLIATHDTALIQAAAMPILRLDGGRLSVETPSEPRPTAPVAAPAPPAGQEPTLFEDEEGPPW
jgi:cell division transport system ATP-binding protein